MNKQSLLIGFTLFSMFFGAGNLIFPAFMASQAGAMTPWALAGFLLTAVACPIAAVLICLRWKNAWNLCAAFSPKFALVFMTVLYLMIGPCLAIPRTASTSFSMLGFLIPDTITWRIAYSLLFFAAAGWTARKPGSLKDVLGKITTPLLILMIALLAVGVFQHPANVAEPMQTYAAHPGLEGAFDGFQTMDILAAMCFADILWLNVKNTGVQKQERKQLLIQAALIAGILLAAAYSVLGIAGMNQSGMLAQSTNGAQVLLALASLGWGSWGTWLAGLLFVTACYNVCSNLLSCTSIYFSQTFHIPYKACLGLFTLAGFILSCFGLDAILQVSAPALEILCPIAVIVLLAGFVKSMKKTGI
jgi:LIVCS family branched-chain amino acid:cation transporter